MIMKLKTRLFLSFLLIIVLPILMAIMVFVFISSGGMQRIGQTNPFYFSNTIDMLSSNTDEEVNRLKQWSKAFPDRFLNQDVLTDINTSLSRKNSFLVIKQGTKIVFDGAPDGMHPRYSQLPIYGKLSATDVMVVKLENQSGMLREVDFGNYRQQYHGQAFVITPTGTVIPGAGRILIQYILWMALILLITAFIIVTLLYNSIIRKVRRMQEATENIRAGNLDFRVDVKGGDELSELAGSIERMKDHLRADAMQKLETEDAQRKFLSNITHDLKTPLTSVIGYSEGIIDGIAPTPDKQMKYVQTIHNKAIEMNDLLNELSVYNKIDTDSIPYNFANINVKGFFGEFAEETKIEFESQNAEFNYVCDVADDTEMVADPSHIKRVLHNLVSNAVKYRRDDTELKVMLKVSDAGEFIQAEVADNGRGISQEDLPHVFERLFRTDKARNTNIKGSGIGLSIVKKIINDHGGQVWATSNEGTGSIFYFLLKKSSDKEEPSEQDSDN